MMEAINVVVDDDIHDIVITDQIEFPTNESDKVLEDTKTIIHEEQTSSVNSESNGNMELDSPGGKEPSSRIKLNHHKLEI